MARRASYIETIRSQKNSLILVDAGNSLASDGDDAHLRNQIIVTSMNVMGYDALNLGSGELDLNTANLNELRELASYPFLSACLTESSTYAAYRIKDLDQVKVGIIGLTSCSRQQGNELCIQDPGASLNHLLESVRRQSSFVIVLANMPYDEAVELAQQVSGIQMLVVAHAGSRLQSLKQVNGTVVVDTVSKGQAIGQVEFTIDHRGQVRVDLSDYVRLDEAVGEASGVTGLIRDHAEAVTR